MRKLLGPQAGHAAGDGGLKMTITTYTRGTRIKAIDEDGNTATIDPGPNVSGLVAHFEAAKALCEKTGYSTLNMKYKTMMGSYTFFLKA